MQHQRHPYYPFRDSYPALQQDRREFLDRAVISFGLPSLFYASLRDPRVFETVVGRPMHSCNHERVTLPGYTLGQVQAGTALPGVFPAGNHSDAGVDCLAIYDLSRFEEIMVGWYEWDEYALRRVTLSDGRAAQVFVPNIQAIQQEYGPVDIEPWSFDTWRAHHLEESVALARDWMAKRPDDESLMEAGCFAMEELPAGRKAAG